MAQNINFSSVISFHIEEGIFLRVLETAVCFITANYVCFFFFKPWLFTSHIYRSTKVLYYYKNTELDKSMDINKTFQ